jgi:hypothetical protein
VLQLTLRVPILLPALEGEVVLQRDVLVSLSPGRSAQADLSVDWGPAGGGGPRFSGIVRTEDFGPKNCALVLEGDSGLTDGGLAACEIAQGYYTATSIARMVLHGVRSMLDAFVSRESELEAM